MKKLVSLLLALGILLTCVPALADAPTVSYNWTERETSPGVRGQDVFRDAQEVIANIGYVDTAYDFSLEVVTPTGNVPVTDMRTGATIGTMAGSNFTVNVPIVWDYYYEGDSTFYDGGVRHQMTVTDADGNVQVINFFVTALSDLYNCDIISTKSIYEEPIKWYPHNTVCVAGIPFRDIRPELTNKWYNFVPLDLSADGVQTYDLVASNLYIVGKVTVKVTGDDVMVTWKINHRGTNDSNFQLENEFMTIFPNLDAVTEVDPAKFDGTTYKFGQHISIENDLGGDTNVLLYICNQATYCNNISYKFNKLMYHARYWPNLKWRINQRNAMIDMVNADLAQ